MGLGIGGGVDAMSMMSAGEELERAAIERMRLSASGNAMVMGMSHTSVGTPLGEDTPAALQAPAHLTTAVEQMR